MTDGDRGLTNRPFPPEDDDLFETPSDPFNRLVLNPGADEDASTNPLCPDCGEPIVPFANQHERRYTCGCDGPRKFSFDRRQEL